MRRRKRESIGGVEPTLEDALASLERTARPVIIRREDAVAAVLISLDDFREHLAGTTPELEVVTPAPEEPEAAGPTDTLEALRELHQLSDL